MIDRSNKLSVARQAKLLGFSRGSVYYLPRPVSGGDLDLTYIPMAHGFVYLCAVVDWFSRRGLSWRLSITMEAAFCIEAVEDALARYDKPHIFNTDRARNSPLSTSRRC
ncbi:hypothetical protein AGR1A_pAt10007 [Agrobacterium fabacearum CFBP 5771]|nr:hypothetical protein AGR1A_pAt10007 [Agrobacterium fabacearum CFBP 5771]